jgi:acyl carrier protein
MTVRAPPEGIVLTPEMRLREDIGVGSYDLLNMVFILEERFDVNILSALPESLATLGDAHALVASLVAGRTPGPS